MSKAEYLLPDQAGEIERLTLQSQVWDPPAQTFCAGSPPGPGGAPLTSAGHSSQVPADADPKRAC
jgi:hypothetical protein